MLNILLLTDFSASSKNAIDYSLELFSNQICHFYILHIPSKSVYTTSDLMTLGNKSIYESLVKKGKQKLEKFIKTIDIKNPKSTLETIVDYDVLTDAVNQTVSAKKIDLIVMGTNGVTGAKEVVFGSNTINVIRKVDCETLVIPESFQFKTPKNLFLPLDIEDSLNSKAFLSLKDFAETFNMNLEVLRIDTKNEHPTISIQDQEHLHLHVKHTSFTYQAVKNKSVYQAVTMYLKNHEIDFMALIVQKETAFERFLTASETKKISEDLKVPLLILHSN